MAMQQILTRFEKDDLAALDSVAARKKLSRAQALREAVYMYVDASPESPAAHNAFGILKSAAPETVPDASEEEAPQEEAHIITEDGEPYDAGAYASGDAEDYVPEGAPDDTPEDSAENTPEYGSENGYAPYSGDSA